MAEEIKKSRLSLKQRLREQFRQMVSMNYSPRKIAASYALGVMIGVSPYLGIHTYMAIGAAALFRLPVFPMLLLSACANPLTLPFIYAAATKLGMKMLGMDVEFDINWSDITFSEIIDMGKFLLLPFFVGTHVAGAILSAFTYLFAYYIVIRYRAWKQKSA